MAWSSLYMECPHCGAYSDHKVSETDPKHYRWSDESTAFFKKHFDKDISFRVRRKWCTKCEKSFQTVEFSRSFMVLMINKLLSQSRDLTQTQDELGQCKEERKALYNKLRTIRKLTDTEKR